MKISPLTCQRHMGSEVKYCATCHSTFPSNLDSCPADNSALSTTSELLQGLIIRRRYEILEKVGAGGMAFVYRARHMAFNEMRAIKVVRGWLAEDEDFVRRLRSEALIARKLKHPNAVHVDDLEELDDGRPFIVMEYVEGTNLRKVIRDEGPLRPGRALAIARQAASALGAAHSLHIVHRDIKPDNIVLIPQMDGSEQVKVMDFGIAKIRGGTTDSNYFETRAGMVLCTPEYASPEQASGKRAEELDGRSDLYSLGIVLYEMITGSLPFRSDTPIGMLLAQINTLPRLPSEARPGIDLPDSVSPLLMKALEKDPAKRFQTADEMLAAMSRVEDDLAATRPNNVLSICAGDAATRAPRDATGEYLLNELERGSNRHLWLYTTVIGLLLIVAGAGGWWWNNTHRSSVVQARALSQRVQETLVHDPSAAGLHANVNNGVVVLSGESNDDASLEQVAAGLAGLEGVSRVDRRDVHVSQASVALPPVAKPAVPVPAAPAPTPPVAMANATHVEPPTPIFFESAKPEGESVTPPSRSIGTQAAQRRTDPRIAELLARAKTEHDDGLYDDEIRDYDAVLRIDRNNEYALRGKRRAILAKQADPGSQP